MHDRTWFRLLVRAIGVLLIGLGLPALVSSVFGIVSAVNAEHRNDWYTYAWYAVVGLTQPLSGLYLLFFADGLIRACVRDAAWRCPRCLADLGTRDAQACPKCGATTAEVPRASP